MSLRSKSTAYILDLLCEGQISGPAESSDWEKSTYLAETVVRKTDGSYNVEGATIIGTVGTANQFLNDFNSGDKIENEIVVSTQVRNDTGPVTRTVTDEDVDHLSVTFSFPQGILAAYDSGKQRELNIGIKITVTPDNGSGTEQTVVDTGVEGIAYSEYRKEFQISNLKTYGDAPWVIKCYKTTDDHTDSSKATYQDDLYWYSYTQIKEAKLMYMNRVVVGTILDAENYGDAIPTRYYKIKGKLIKIPSNYDPVGRVYSGVWDGTFTTAFSNNPAWIVYDLLTDIRYGLGLRSWQVDKWTLYLCGQYCDGTVTYKQDVRQADGTYDRVEVDQPRFTCNTVIGDREQALAVINHFCSVFMAFPIWSSGLVSFIQDSPANTTRVASTANVIDGLFEYEGTAKNVRYTAAKVTWNNPDYFGKQDVVVVEDRDGIKLYGYNPLDVTAVGCTNRNEAILKGKYALYTSINQTELVKFKGGLEWADAFPGEIIRVQDPDYAAAVYSGRIISSTSYSVTVDNPITIPSGTCYLYVQRDSTTVAQRLLTNTPASNVSVLTFDYALQYPSQAGNVWLVTTPNLDARRFRILSVKEVEKTEFEILAYEYDPNKYSVVEDNLYIEPQLPTTFSTGALEAPSNIQVDAFSYLDGDKVNRKYGMRISWTASDDPRTEYYELKYKLNDGQLQDLGTSGDTSFVWEDVLAGTYDIYVRAVSLTGRSQWATYYDFIMINSTGTAAAPTNLRTSEGSNVFSGKNCHMIWDPPIDSTSIYNTYTDESGNTMYVYSGNTGKIKDYKVEVYDTDTLLLLRETFTGSELIREYIYTYEMNMEDTSGLPDRTLTFKVYSVGLDDNLSDPVARAVSNPAPDMSGTLPVVTPRTGYLEIDWANLADIDMAFYKVYIDTSNPPTTYVGQVNYPTNRFEYFNVEYGTTYYVKIIPYDGFGVGIASQIPSGASPLLIPSINVDVELTASITKTYSDSTGYIGDIETLYDRVIDSSGIIILNPDGEYIQYEYSIKDFIDRVAIWSYNVNPKVYLAYSDDGITWSYLKAGIDHLIPEDRTMLDASNESDAQTNYWQLEAGFNYALWPNNITARFVRLHFVNNNLTQIYEFIPSRIIIAELAAIESLSAISANIGNITAGVIQSDDYSANLGFKIDMDDKSIYLGGNTTPVMKFWQDGGNKYLDITAAVTFRSGSTGYANIDDKPADSAIYNTYNQNNGNISPYPDFEGESVFTNNRIGGWWFTWNNTKPNGGGVNYSTDWIAINCNTIWWNELAPLGGAETSKYSYVYSGKIQIEVGKNYCFSVYTGAHRCRVDAYIQWYKSDDTGNGNSAITTNDAAFSGGKYISGYYRHTSFGVCPADTAYARLILLKYQTKTGQTSSYIFACLPMMSVVGSNQTEAPAWSPAGSDNSYWKSASDITKIDGGKIYVGSTITLNEGGKAVFGNQNVIIDTAGSHGSIVVAPDGGPTSQHYCKLDNADINFMYWNGNTHKLYTAMTRIESGICSANSNVTIPGIWKQTPSIIVSPNSLQVYNASYPSQTQTIKCYASNITPTGNTYYFYANAQLDLGANSVGAAGAGVVASSSGDFNTSQVNLAANTRRLVVTCTCHGYRWDASEAVYYSYGETQTFQYYQNAYRHCNYQVILYYYAGGWTNVPAWQYSSSTTAGGYAQTKTFTFDTGTLGTNITAYYLRMYITGYDSKVTNYINTGSSYVGAGYRFVCNDQGYTSNLINAAVLAYGSLNWLAIGK